MARSVAILNMATFVLVLVCGVTVQAQKVREPGTISAPGNTFATFADGIGSVAAQVQSTAVFQSLGDLPGGTSSSGAYAVSDDGSIVLGYGYSDSGRQMFIRDHVRRMRNLSDILVNDLGLDMTGWTGIHVNDLSTNRRVIIGDGTNPSGDLEAWRIVLPCDAHASGCLGEAIPAVTEWGMVAMTPLVLTADTVVLTRRRVARYQD